MCQAGATLSVISKAKIMVFTCYAAGLPSQAFGQLVTPNRYTYLVETDNLNVPIDQKPQRETELQLYY